MKIQTIISEFSYPWIVLRYNNMYSTYLYLNYTYLYLYVLAEDLFRTSCRTRVISLRGAAVILKYSATRSNYPCLDVVVGVGWGGVARCICVDNNYCLYYM